MLNCDNVNEAWLAGTTQLLCMASIASTFVLICANSHDRIHVRLNENERMGKNEWRAKTWKKRGVDEYRRVGKNRENGNDIIV